METLAHDENRLTDLRLVREGKQLPYVLDNTGAPKSFPPHVAVLESPNRGRSRWGLTLPFHPLPVTSIRCSTDTPLFQRSVRLFEEAPGARGDRIDRSLGQATWGRALGQAQNELALKLDRTPQTNRLILEVDDGDNPPLHLLDFRCDYRSPRLLFKASPGSDLYLYYGRREAAMPQYDLNLAAHTLLTARLVDAPLSSEEALKATTGWVAAWPSGATRFVFWGVMALVVLALLGVIAKLLPSEK